jgi:hypothetical protein
MICSVRNWFFCDVMLGIMEESAASVFMVEPHISGGILLSKNKVFNSSIYSPNVGRHL